MSRPKYSLRSLLIGLTIVSVHLAVTGGDPRLVTILAPVTAFVVATWSFMLLRRGGFFDAILVGAAWATGVTTVVGTILWPWDEMSVRFESPFERAILTVSFSFTYGVAVALLILLLIAGTCMLSCWAEHLYRRPYQLLFVILATFCAITRGDLNAFVAWSPLATFTSAVVIQFRVRRNHPQTAVEKLLLAAVWSTCATTLLGALLPNWSGQIGEGDQIASRILGSALIAFGVGLAMSFVLAACLGVAYYLVRGVVYARTAGTTGT